MKIIKNRVTCVAVGGPGDDFTDEPAQFHIVYRSGLKSSLKIFL